MAAVGHSTRFILCARALKARYNVDNDLMEATCPKRGSFTWRSILWGKELFKEGLIWRVANDSKIRIQADRWIPRKGSCSPLGFKDNPDINLVSDMLDEYGRN